MIRLIKHETESSPQVCQISSINSF